MSDKEPTTVTLFIARYNELVEAEMKLRYLENWGVDNWEGYDDAMREMKENEVKDGPRQVFR